MSVQKVNMVVGQEEGVKCFLRLQLRREVRVEKRVVRVVGINGRYTHSCLALFHLRQELVRRAPQLEVELCQLTINDNYFETLLRLAEGAPAALLFSAVIWNSNRIEKLLADLLRMLPQTLFVVGGPQAEVVGAAVESFAPGLSSRVCVVKGEVEALPDSFFSGLVEGRLSPKYVASFFGMERPHFASPYVDEDFRGADAPLANRHVYYESSRGCPFRCTYCLSSVEKRVVHKELSQVKKELRHILSHRPKIIRFIDRTFNDRPERALALWRFLVDEGGETRFHFEMAPERFNDEMFAFLAQLPPGLFQFEIGIQSTDPDVLAAVKRRADQALVRANIRRLAALGTVHLHLDLILGLPFCTRKSFYRSFRDVFAMGGHYIQMGLLKVLPGTEIARRAVEYGLVFTRRPPYAVVATRWLNASQLTHLYWFSELVEKFINNRKFTSLWQRLRESGEDIVLLFERLLTLCQQQNVFASAPTHELLGEKLLQILAGHDDEVLLRGLLLFDWLRCGHRRLPGWFPVEEEPTRTRARCRETAPAVLPGLYDRRGRSRFFRTSLFVRIESELAEYLSGTTAAAPILCVLAEDDGGLEGWNRVIPGECGAQGFRPLAIKKGEKKQEETDGEVVFSG